MSKFQITLSEYNRIYQVAHGVLKDVANSEKACVFFACFGAMILNKHFKIPARAVAGGFALCANDVPEVAFFGQVEDGRLVTSPDGFHMWVQTRTHIIDFMAPIFPEAFVEAGRKLTVPRKMFQRELTAEASVLADLSATGEFFTLPDLQLTETLIDNFLRRPSSTDLLLVAHAWFGERRKEQKKSFAMRNDLGEIYQLVLPPSAMGSW